jgi:hypothetical protein
LALAWAFLTDREAVDSLGREAERERERFLGQERKRKKVFFIFFNYSFLFFYLKPTVKFSFESI